MLGSILLGSGLVPAAAAQPAALPVGVDVDYQLGGPAPVPAHVGIVVRDRVEAPLAGRFNICYVNAFQTQPGERRVWRRHRNLVLHRNGSPVPDRAWPDEWLLDHSSRWQRRGLLRIVGRWIHGCARAGFDAVEFDNLDSFSRSGGLLRARTANRYAAGLVRKAHRYGLLAGQKNRADWNGTRVGFDFAVAESCARWRECGRYRRHYGTDFVAIEYRRRDFNAACETIGTRVAVVLADRALRPRARRAWC